MNRLAQDAAGRSQAAQDGASWNTQQSRHFRPTPFARWCVTAGAFAAGIGRLSAAVASACMGDLQPLTSFGFTVAFPLMLIAGVMRIGAGRTREGVLMRLGTMFQLLLVIAVPPYALHMLLGLPVVFLAVELFETRAPASLRGPVERWLVAC